MVPLPTLISLDPGSTGKHLRATPTTTLCSSFSASLAFLKTSALVCTLLPTASLVWAWEAPGGSWNTCWPGTQAWVPALSWEGSLGSAFEPPGELSLHRLSA